MYKYLTASPIIDEQHPILCKQRKNSLLVNNISGLRFQKLIFNELKINTAVDKQSYILYQLYNYTVIPMTNK